MNQILNDLILNFLTGVLLPKNKQRKLNSDKESYWFIQILSLETY